jgi:hypothetical protein
VRATVLVAEGIVEHRRGARAAAVAQVGEKRREEADRRLLGRGADLGGVPAAIVDLQRIGIGVASSATRRSAGSRSVTLAGAWSASGVS